MTWNEKAGRLTIGKQEGEFPGMLKKRTFHVVFVGEGHGAGVGVSEGGWIRA
jgi:alpha-D-xyloside xylohydrolase